MKAFNGFQEISFKDLYYKLIDFRNTGPPSSTKYFTKLLSNFKSLIIAKDTEVLKFMDQL